MQEQRQYHALRAHIEQMLQRGWSISKRHPMQLRNQHNRFSVRCGMLISE